MKAIARRLFIRGNLVLALSIALGICSIGFASTAHAASLTSSDARLTKDKPAITQCYRLVVHLNGENPATATCVARTAADMATAPLISTSCSSNPRAWLYEDASLGGASICFSGTGQANLANYWIVWPVRNWDNNMSSFKVANACGEFYQYYPPGGFQYDFDGTYSVTWVGSNWNDYASSIWIKSTAGNCSHV